MSLQVRIEVKKLFLDRDRVIKATDRAQRRALNRVGGAIRLTARRSIRKRKKSSAPGKPPSSHTQRLRRGIFYAYEPKRTNVVIGPVSEGTPEQLEALEAGGNVEIQTKKRGEPARRETIKIEARPFMGPAERINRERIPDAFKDAVRS